MTAALRTGGRHRQRLRGRHVYRSRRTHLVRHLKLTDLLIFPAMALAVFMGLPVQWGGQTSYILVRGDSMLPTYQTGDLVIVRESDAYRVGDIVAYRVPELDLGAGTLILHRIVDEVGDGRFILQGDNNEELDSWKPESGDMVGEAAFSVSRIGSILAVVRSPELLASIGFGIAFAMVVVRPETRKGAHEVNRNRSHVRGRSFRNR